MDSGHPTATPRTRSARGTRSDAAPRCRCRCKRAFTLIEMLVVIGVLVALIGISIPVLSIMQHRARVNGTDTLVETIATAITAYQLSRWPVHDPSSGQVRQYVAWDWNRDHLLDGHPEADDPGITNASHADHLLYQSGYRGFAEHVQPDVARQFRGEDGRIVDAWGNVLRIAWSARAYGASGFGVWSLGEDGRDRLLGTPADDADNLTSWTNE